jgi:two-component system, LytTR family, response regulator LytT
MNILIIEDEPRTAKLLKEFILAVDDTHTVLGICDSVESTVQFLGTTTHRVDLLFMDIQLADGSSFDIFQKIVINVPVIFCTAYEDHLLEAFKSNGIDYILKPFHEKDIEQAFRKLDQIRSSLLLAPSLPARIQQALVNRTQSSFLVRFREKMYPVAIRDIAAIALEKEVVYIYTYNKEKYALFRPIDDIEAALDPQTFFRINRQMILNRDAILEIEPFFNRRVIVTLKVPTAERPLVSRLKVTPFLEWVEKA